MYISAADPLIVLQSGELMCGRHGANLCVFRSHSSQCENKNEN